MSTPWQQSPPCIIPASSAGVPSDGTYMDREGKVHTLRLTSHRRFTAPIEYTVTTYRQEPASSHARTCPEPPTSELLSPLRGSNRYGANPPRGRIADAANAALAVTAPPPLVQEGSDISEWLFDEAPGAMQPPSQAVETGGRGRGPRLIPIPEPLSEAFDPPEVDSSDVLHWASRTGMTPTRLTHGFPPSPSPPPRRAAPPALPVEDVHFSPSSSASPKSAALSRPGISGDDVARATKANGHLASRPTVATTPAQQAAAKAMSAAVAAAARATTTLTCSRSRMEEPLNNKRKAIQANRAALKKAKPGQAGST